MLVFPKTYGRHRKKGHTTMTATTFFALQKINRMSQR